jgi:hypothetical protein
VRARVNGKAHVTAAQTAAQTALAWGERAAESSRQCFVGVTAAANDVCRRSATGGGLQVARSQSPPSADKVHVEPGSNRRIPYRQP